MATPGRSGPPPLDPVRDPEVRPHGGPISGQVPETRVPPDLAPEAAGLTEDATLDRGTVDVGVSNPIPLVPDLALAIKSYYKVVLVGDPGVGKSSIISRLADQNPILNHYVSTNGVDIKIHAVEKDGITTKLQIWDSASVRTIIANYCQGAHGIIIVYDVTDQDSFNNVREWLDQGISCAGSDVKILLIGNKSDLDGEKVVSSDAAKGIQFMETSALNPSDVEYALLTMFSAITYRDWSGLNSDLLIEIFNRAPAWKPQARALMVRVCWAWRNTIFSAPLWPTVLDPVLYDWETFLKFDEYETRTFEFIDPIRNLPPINLGTMRLIGCDGSTYLLAENVLGTFDRRLVLWSLLSEPGKPGLKQHEVSFKLTDNLLCVEDMYLGSSVFVSGIGRRVIIAADIYHTVLWAATFSQGGDLLGPWTIVAKCPNRRFVSIVFYNGTAFMLDRKGELCSVSLEGSSIVLYERPVPCIEQRFVGHTSFNRPHRDGHITSWLIILPGTTAQEADRLVCLNYEEVNKYTDRRSYSVFWASHLYEVEVNGLMGFEKIWDLGTSTVLLSHSRCNPVVVREPKAIGFYENSVYCLPRTKEDGLSAYYLHEYFEHSSHEFESDWPCPFFALSASKVDDSVSSSEKPSDCLDC